VKLIDSYMFRTTVSYPLKETRNHLPIGQIEWGALCPPWIPFDNMVFSHGPLWMIIGMHRIPEACNARMDDIYPEHEKKNTRPPTRR
jgi:hypothetical protein